VTGRGFVIGAALVAVSTNPTLAQRASGMIRDGTTGEPVGGAVVVVSDATGKFLARSIAGADGRFAVPRLAGSSRLRVVRIGYRPRDQALTGAAADSSIDVRLEPIPAALTTVTAASRRVCPGELGDSQALELWEQARAALFAAVVSREAHPARVRLRSFVRMREPVRRRIEFDSAATKDVTSDRSYVAGRPAWALAADGYVLDEPGGSRQYFAPDEDVMLDPSFAGTHCLRVVAGRDDHGGEIGIGFEPVEDARRDTIVDIGGVLWLDRSKVALRSLEFHYTRLEPVAGDSGGDLTFALAPNGAPMIVKWVIRSPIIATDALPAPNGVRRNPLPRARRTNVRLLALEETGGMVDSAVWPDGTAYHGDLPRATGIVVDPAGAPVPGARVWLRNAHDTVTTGADGTFNLPYVRPGFYVLLASDSALAGAGFSRTVPVVVPLFSPRETHSRLSYLPRLDVFLSVCPPKSYRPGTGVLLVRVVDGDGAALLGSRIEVETRQMIAGADTTTRAIHRSGNVDEDGRFIVCGAALDQPLFVRAINGTDGATAVLREWTDEVMTLTLVIKPSAR